MDLVRFRIIRGEPIKAALKNRAYRSNTVLFDVFVAEEQCVRLDMDNPLVRELVL
jgi:hypothetical protein